MKRYIRSTDYARLERLGKYKDRRESETLARNNERQANISGLLSQVAKLEPRIKELLSTANAAIACGISMDKFHYLTSYEVVFIDKPIVAGYNNTAKRPKYLGIKFYIEDKYKRGKGWDDSGCRYFYTDGCNSGEWYETDVHYGKGADYIECELDDFCIQSFLDHFDEFEQKVYDYIDTESEK